MTEDRALLPVTQKDRDAVQAFHRIQIDRIMRGDRTLGDDKGDEGVLVQAFAAHRLTAEQDGWQGERWRPIADFEGKYEVSDRGRVRSLDRFAPQYPSGIQKTNGQILASRVNQDGYNVVGLRSGNKKRRMFRVHRLVAQAFIPNPQNLPVVNHIDCNPSNDEVWNLEWCTQAQNLDHSRRLGRMPNRHATGVRPTTARLSNDAVVQIRKEYSAGGVSLQTIADRLGLSKRTVHRAITGATYKDLPTPPANILDSTKEAR